MTEEEMFLDLQEGFMLLSDGKRIPPVDILQELYYLFGSLVGLYDNRRDLYVKTLNLYGEENAKRHNY